jgi:hypothetical protein
MGRGYSGLIAAEGRVFTQTQTLTDQVVLALDAETGETVWQYRYGWPSDRPGQATIAAADGKLFLFNDQGEVLLIRANPQRYEELAHAEVFPGELCWTAPSLDGGRLYLRSPTRAACLYVGKSDRPDGRQRGVAAASAPPKGRSLELGWVLGAEREFPFQLPDLRELAWWYAFCTAALGAAATIGLAVGGMARGGDEERNRRHRRGRLGNRRNPGGQPVRRAVRFHLAPPALCRPSACVDERPARQAAGRRTKWRWR